MSDIKGDLLKGFPEDVFKQDEIGISIKTVDARELYGRRNTLKPTNVPIGTTFFNIDDKELWMFNGEEWVVL